MKVKYLGKSNPVALLNGKEYDVVSKELKYYRIVDEEGEDYLYHRDSFEIVESLPEPPSFHVIETPLEIAKLA